MSLLKSRQTSSLVGLLNITLTLIDMFLVRFTCELIIELGAASLHTPYLSPVRLAAYNCGDLMIQKVSP